jgi:DNA-binding HxlR family transcriptional regulator
MTSEALHGITRYDDFIARLGVPTTTLSRRLSQLVDAGVLTRHRYRGRPPRDEYRLTERGFELAVIVAVLREWGDRHRSPGGPPAAYRHQGCGGPLAVEMRCGDCDENLTPRTVERVEHRPVPRA